MQQNLKLVSKRYLFSYILSGKINFAAADILLTRNPTDYAAEIKNSKQATHI
jgi:hypothetical protein